jgi:hypothetical protein
MICPKPGWLGLEIGHWVTIAVGLLATLGVVLGWFLTSWLTSRRDYRNRQESMIVDYLVEAYESFAMVANRPPTDENKEYMRKAELAVVKIQLFGSSDEIRTVQHFLREYAQPQPDNTPRADLNRLLFLLRSSLRDRLALQKIDSPIHWFRPFGGA